MTEEEHKNTVRAYGQTFGDLEKIKNNQIHGTVNMIEANNAKAEDFTDKYFREDYSGYKIPDHDKMHYHVAIEARGFNQQSGEKFSHPHVQCMDVATFNSMMAMKPYDGFHGMSVHILHNPTKKEKAVVDQIQDDLADSGKSLKGSQVEGNDDQLSKMPEVKVPAKRGPKPKVQ